MFRKKVKNELTRPDTYDGHGRSVQDMIDELNGRPFTKNEQVALKILQDTKDRKIKWEVQSEDNMKLWSAFYGKYNLFIIIYPNTSWENLDETDKPDWVRLKNTFEIYLCEGDDKDIISGMSISGCIIDELLAELNEQAPIIMKNQDIIDGVLGVKL